MFVGHQPKHGKRPRWTVRTWFFSLIDPLFASRRDAVDSLLGAGAVHSRRTRDSEGAVEKASGPASTGSKAVGKSRAQPSESIRAELEAAGDRLAAVSREDKKNYAERLSRALAQRFADGLRPHFDGILPDPAGKGQESKARSAKGFKKLDVNYSTLELGLGLGVSIKTINFRDPKTKRYTKNYTRVDAELRAEATDYHDRQPYAVMVAVVFLPLDSCDDGGAQAPSSFGQSVQIFRFRSGRHEPSDPPLLFERVFIGLYDTAEETFGNVGFFDVTTAPPKHGRPRKLLTWQEMVEEIVRTYDERNRPPFQWADAEEEPVTDLPAGADVGDDEVA
jgi:hypothetical protein